jgi:predicted ferric reductase
VTTAVTAPSSGTVHTTPGEDRRARTDAAVRATATVLLWAGLALVTWWWASGGGVTDLAAWDTGLTSLGRLTGLLAADMLLVQVVIMSRLPVLERAFGQDRLARLHRLTGFTSFDLMVCHVVLITWGYAAGELSQTPATLWDLTLHYPGMLLAVAGTACLVMVVVTSVRAARRRLRYESWHLLHLYAYLGVGLALPHQLWTGQEFLRSPAATVYWWSLWIAAAGAVLVWRVALPLLRSTRHRLRVTTVVPEGEGVVSVYLTGRHLDRLPVEAGQFLIWRFLAGPGWMRAHPYSLSAAPDGRSLRITVKDSGDGSAAVARLRPGTRALIEGPHGRMSPRARTRRRVLLIGAGVGIAPLRALAEALPYGPGEATLLYRYRGRPLYEQEFSALARERGLQVLFLPGHRRSADSWLCNGVPPVPDAAVLASWVPDLAHRDVYVCGPEDWAADVRRSAEAAGLPAGRCHVESFGW